MRALIVWAGLGLLASAIALLLGMSLVIAFLLAPAVFMIGLGLLEVQRKNTLWPTGRAANLMTVGGTLIIFAYFWHVVSDWTILVLTTVVLGVALRLIFLVFDRSSRAYLHRFPVRVGQVRWKKVLQFLGLIVFAFVVMVAANSLLITAGMSERTSGWISVGVFLIVVGFGGFVVLEIQPPRRK